jgi:hypothetical protein
MNTIGQSRAMSTEEVGPKLKCAKCDDKEPKVTRVLRNERNETRVVCVAAGHELASGWEGLGRPPGK